MHSTLYIDEQSTQVQEQKRANYQAHYLSHAAQGIVCEILPITLEAQQMLFLRRPTDSYGASWLVPHHEDMHPSDTVLLHLLSYFDGVFEPDASIVHSTSWRYDRRVGQVILTFLVVLPQRTWMRQWEAAERLHFERIGDISKVYGDNLSPPVSLERDAVLAHALDHLALLSRDDMHIQAVLMPEWMDVLKLRLPKPAGLFVGCYYSGLDKDGARGSMTIS